MAVGPYVAGILQAVAGLVSLGFLKPALDNRDKPGAGSFGLFVIATTLWMSALAVGNFISDLQLSLAVYNFVLLFSGAAGAAWLLVALDVTDHDANRRKIGVVIVTVLGVIQLLSWTNPLHQLVFGPETHLRGSAIVIDFGPGFWMHAILGHLFAGTGEVILLRDAIRSTGIRRKQSFLLVLSVLPLILANGMYLSRFPSTPYDLSPFGFLVTAPFLIAVLFEGRFLDIRTVARRTAMEEMDDAMVTLDDQNRVIDANARARSVLDVSGEFVGMPATEFFEAVPTEIRRQFTETTDDLREITVERDGDQRHFLVSVSPVGREASRGRVFVFRDITDQKHRERRLRHQKEQLDQLTSVISHDLRNPLNAAQLQFDLVCEDVPEDHARKVERNLDRMEAMIDDLLTMSGAGETVEESEPVSLKRRANTAWDNVDTTGATLDIDISDGTFVLADGDRLLRLFENLFRNAVDHNTSPLRLRVGELDTITRDGTLTGFFVEDDGNGISDDEREEVFEYGYTTSEDGTGLGLSIVQDIVEAHGWDIAVTEGSDGGARFEITNVETAEGWGDRPSPVDAD